jgi:hypothetical protein
LACDGIGQCAADNQLASQTMMGVKKPDHFLLVDSWSVELFAYQIPGQGQQQGI